MFSRRLFNLMMMTGMGNSLNAFADNFPSKPIKIVVPTAAGTSSDGVGRYISSKISNIFSQPVIIENKPGGEGVIATDYVASSPSDGYTLLNTFAIHYMLQWIKKSKYDAVKDFEPIAQYGVTPLVLITSNNSIYNNVSAIIEAAKNNPGKITCASAASTSTLAAALMENISGIKLNIVPYKAVPQSIIDTSSRVVDLAFCGMSAGLPLIRAGKVRAIAVTTSNRSVILPDLPTLAEQGIKGYDFSTPIWLFGPKGIDEKITNKLSEAIISIARTDEFREFCLKHGLEVDIKNKDQLKVEIAAEASKWKRYVEIAGLNT